jgi:3D (Asp-Asp-Asp) domain-containing protein
VLQISQGASAGTTALRIENTETGIDPAQTANAIEFYTNDASAGGTGVTGKISHVAVNSGSTYALTFSTYNGGTLSESMRIDSSGNVGIGTSAPATALDVVGDVTVSGGVYLGGTVAANKLDDYEEGTWTPTAADASSGGNTGTTGTGTYTKTGNTVRVTAALPNVVTTGMTAGNTFSVQGFPFGTGDIFGVTGIFTSCTVHTSAVTTSSAVWSLMVDNGVTSTQFYDTGGAILVSDITSGSGDFYFTVVYQTA